MRPAETSDDWKKPSAASLDHVTRADCATPHQEAVVIALALREALEHETRTAALVTPDRDLAKRVTAELRRWNIEIDDSAGRPLADTPPATLLRCLVAAVDSGFAPVELLALLKHPLCSLGLARPALLDAARRLDRKVLRGLKPTPGFEALAALVEDAKFADETDRAQVQGFDRPREKGNDGARRRHVRAGDAAGAARSHDHNGRGTRTARDAMVRRSRRGAGGLSRQPEGRVGRPAEIAGGEWPTLLLAMLAPETIRPRFGRHPRLAIWGPLEARLQRADLLIPGRPERRKLAAFGGNRAVDQPADARPRSACRSPSGGSGSQPMTSPPPWRPSASC